jgi:hypothetical protein
MTTNGWPSQLLVERSLDPVALEDVGGSVEAGLAAALGDVRWSGDRIAVAAGSRGIDRIPEVVAAVVQFVRARGGSPFVMPAMGSHGGATGEGQAAILRALGIDESTVGAPIVSSVDVVDVGPTADGLRVVAARDAVQAAGIILVNRIKPHTDFMGPFGSGLQKMAAIGLGKVEGAFACHKAAASLGHEHVIRLVARRQIERLPIIAGVALVEGPRHALAHCAVLRPKEFETREPELLAKARGYMPGLPVPDIDVLVVDEIGKNISGAGMDTNVIGRGVDGQAFGEGAPRIGAIYARSLSPESKGNAIGLGLADVVSARLVRGMDAHATFTNGLSALTPSTVRVPMHFETDQECLEAAIRLARVDDRLQARIVRIPNTLRIDRFLVSAACAADVAARKDMRVVGDSRPLVFDAAGNLEGGPADLLASGAAH